MSEGNLLDQQQQLHLPQQSRKFLYSSKESELELLGTGTSSPEVRSRSQSVGSAHREALLFFEQHRLFQNSPDLDFARDEHGDCELRSISSTSRNSSPAIAKGALPYKSTESHLDPGVRHNYQQRQQKYGHQQQVQSRHKNTELRQQSESSLLESSAAAVGKAATFLSSGGEAAYGGASNQTNNSHCFDDNESAANIRGRSQSQGQCGSLRRRQDSCSSVIVFSSKESNQGNDCRSGTQATSTWLDEIQFKAQYQHYRTNNYASVVSSASSLDKSDGGIGSSGGRIGTDGVALITPSEHGASNKVKKDGCSEAERASSSSARIRSRNHPQFARKGNEDDDGAEERLLQSNCVDERDNLNRENSITSSQCWNFPRVKLKKLFAAKSLDDILGGRGGRRSSASRSGLTVGDGRKKSLQVVNISAAAAGEEKVSQGGSGGGGGSERNSSSSSDSKGCASQKHTKKAQLRRDNKLSLLRFQHEDEDKAQLLLVKQSQGGSASPGGRSSKSASDIVISSTVPSAVPSKQRKGPVFLKATRQKSRSFSALTSVILNRVHGQTSSSGNSPSGSSVTSGGGASTFFKRGLQDNKNASPVVPTKKSGHVVPCAKSDNCLNRIVASATCAKFVDYFSADSSAKGSKPSSTTLVEPFALQSSTDELQSGPSSFSTASSLSGVVTAQPRKWTAIKNKWDQKLQASGDRQKEIGASLASVSNNAQIFRKSHHQPRQRSSSLSPLDNPEDGKSIESLLEITSPSPTLQEVRFLDTPEIRYASPLAVRSSRSAYNTFYADDDEEDNNEEESVTLTEGTVNLSNSSTTITGGNTSRPSSRASSACSSCTVSSTCSDCREREEALEEELDTVGEMTRHHSSGAPGVASGGKRARDHHHRHHGKHHHSPKEKPKLVVANVTYLARPMSPGLLLRESSPSSGAAGGADSIGNMTGGSYPGASGSDQVGIPSTVIRNSNVLTNKNNNQQPMSAQYKSQQAKLEFLKSFAPVTPQQTPFKEKSSVNKDEQQRKRDPLCAKIVNVNEGNYVYSPSDSDFISPCSSSGGGASENRSSCSPTGIGSNNPIIGPSSRHGTHQGAPCRNDRQVLARQADCAGAVGGGASEFSSGVTSSRYSKGAVFTEQSSGAAQHYTQQMRSNFGERSADNESADGGGISPSASDRKDFLPTNQAPQTLTQQSSINNNLLIDVDFEGSDDTMGDLQSPQYVKRTAHMFDSRFSSEPETNGHERNARNPSYLNVSRSVSGYSCLSYNNGSLTAETVTNKTMLGNGTSLISSGTRLSPAGARIKTDFSLHSPFGRGKVLHTDDDSSDHSSNQSATSPPPSLPPINTTSAHGRITDSPFFQNGINRGDDLIDDTPYIPSHGKSFIMQRIERLYGSDAVSSKGAIRKSSNVTTISITRDSITQGKERIIPIKVESRDDHQNNVFNNESEGVILPIICSNDESGRHVEPRCTRLPINDSDDDDQSDSMNGKRRSPSRTLGHLNGNANRYRNDGNVATNGNEVRVNVSPTERTVTSSLYHANGSTNRPIDEDCTTTRKVLSRESSAGSVDSNECSENSIELGSISSDVDSRKSIVKRLDSIEDGISGTVKPKPKPKPKDMALLRTLSRSPGLKTGTENLDKTAIINIVQHEVIRPVSKFDNSCEDQIDGESYSTLTDIKNKVSTADKAADALPGKTSPQLVSSIEAVDNAADKENAPRPQSVDKVLVGNSGAVRSGTNVKDGNYFLNEMKNVTSEILRLSEKAAVELETIDESEDRAGSIHAAIGKGNLLVKKKFKQFEGLCQANLKGSTGDEPVTTDEDLAGFWDMVMIQVDQVYSLFADLEKKEEEPVPKTPMKSASPKRMPASTSKPTRPSVGTTPKVNSAAAKARDEARRKLLAERRKAMKSQMQETQETVPVAGEPEAEVQIFTPGAPQTG